MPSFILTLLGPILGLYHVCQWKPNRASIFPISFISKSICDGNFQDHETGDNETEPMNQKKWNCKSRYFSNWIISSVGTLYIV